MFILFAIIARYFDRKDDNKIGLNMLIDNKIEDNYYYEIIVFTGNRKEAATDSIVRFIFPFESVIICLEEDEASLN